PRRPRPRPRRTSLVLRRRTTTTMTPPCGYASDTPRPTRSRVPGGPTAYAATRPAAAGVVTGAVRRRTFPRRRPEGFTPGPHINDGRRGSPARPGRCPTPRAGRDFPTQPNPGTAQPPPLVDMVGSIGYLTPDGAWYVSGRSRDDGGPITYPFGQGRLEFPVDALVPLQLIGIAVKDFLATSGRRRPPDLAWRRWPAQPAQPPLIGEDHRWFPTGHARCHGGTGFAALGHNDGD